MNVICCKCVNGVMDSITLPNGGDCGGLTDINGAAGYSITSCQDPCAGGDPVVYEIEDYDISQTIGYTETNKRWNSFYSYAPEFMCGAGTRIVTFNAGSIYEHNSYTTTPAYNTFYGTTYNSEIHVISNEAPSNNKVYKAFSQESDDIWDVDFETPNGQTSNLIASDFDTRENIHYSDIMNDTSSLGGLLEGDKMRDASLIAKVKILTVKFTRLFGVNFNVFPSYRSNK